MREDDFVIGIDVGTEAARAGVFDRRGALVSEGCVMYETRHLRLGWVEQDPHVVLASVYAAVKQAIKDVPPSSIFACSLASTAVSVLAADASGAPLAPAILWMDTRAVAEADEINATEDPALWYTGGAVSPEWMLPKALWLKRKTPQLYAAAQWLIEVHDWIIYCFTGEWALSYATTSAEWTYVRDAGGWPLDLLKRVGLDDLPEKWPKRMLRPGQVVGELTDEAAAETGLRKGLPIAQGMMDSYAAAIACNVFVPGRLSLSLGTSSCYLALTAAPVSDRRLLGPVPDPFGDKRWVMQGGQTSAGAPVRWFSDELGGGRSNDVLDNEAAAIPAGSEGVFAVDTWQGSRSPHRAPSARGGFFGVSVGHSRGHLYRSLLEAVAYGGREILETMHEASVDCRSIVACGGGSRSDLWMQIHADVLQRQISVLDCKHAAALGAAMCAAVGAGFETDLQSAAAAMSMNARHFEPRRETREVYDFGYQRYRRAYQDLEAIRAAHPPSLYE